MTLRVLRKAYVTRNLVNVCVRKVTVVQGVTSVFLATMVIQIVSHATVVRPVLGRLFAISPANALVSRISLEERANSAVLDTISTLNA